MLAERGNFWAEKSTKTTETVDTVKSCSNQIRKASKLMKFDEFGIWNGAANKVVKQHLKIEKDLDNICPKKVIGKDTNLCAER